METFFRQTTMQEEHERQESVRTVSPAALPLPARAAHAVPPERPPRPPALYTEVNRERQVRENDRFCVILLEELEFKKG